MSGTHPRKSTNLSLDQSLLLDARSLKINLSRAAEDGIREAVARSLEERWKSENREAIEASNRYVENNGLPLAWHRQF